MAGEWTVPPPIRAATGIGESLDPLITSSVAEENGKSKGVDIVQFDSDKNAVAPLHGKKIDMSMKISNSNLPYARKRKQREHDCVYTTNVHIPMDCFEV
ncbi:hypothetical protein FNV43_RR10684 [Rhamnella rubrinervis]|uniref:Uncharacterized protein n=1 Tax=Rhamnella rubrinervis TaxID=2594499 RepID=A0A8K0MH58_9ROSA|nr:hypothetical protein FNV43_RR10684 [Rhamnella rubrinervis]